jgi:hypothetical protein
LVWPGPEFMMEKSWSRQAPSPQTLSPSRWTPLSAAPILPYPVIRHCRKNAGSGLKHCCFCIKHCQKAGKMVNPGILRARMGSAPEGTPVRGVPGPR